MTPSGVLLVLSLGGILAPCGGQVLTPPYFNLAEGRRITATATCGVGVDDPELYCKLVGANSDKPLDTNVIQGQLCDYCDPSRPSTLHPPEFAIDGSERWWQSPPLSRGMEYNEVNLTIDLGQLFQVAYVVVKMANSPRPGMWVLERSVDNGKTYTPWQFFAENVGDCERFFGEETLKPITSDDDVICTTRFSKVVPLEGGEIFVPLLNGRPSAQAFFNSTVLQEFTRATNVRLRLLRTKTLLGHLMSVARQDPTVTRRYFYSIKDISIGGRCVCNGHASVCDIADPDDPFQLQCRCQHNTCGAQCEECCPGFIQKRWRPASNFENFVCEPCNCFGHTDECIYDENVEREGKSLDIHGHYEGGGVCQNCRHHTEGINCDKCVDGFYRPYDKNFNDTDVCQPCQCQGHFYTGNCFDGNGLCECRKEFLPPYCDACNDGYYNYPNCKPCDCHKDGTVGGICEVGGGQCPCKENYMSLNCDQCAPGYYNFPECSPCACSSLGSLNNVCDATSGQCKCQNNYGGLKCDRCEHGYFDYSNGCEFCNCDARGTVEEICEKQTGECLCREGYSGRRCDTNAPGFWGYPLGERCGCHEKGSSSSVCDASGKCACNNGYSSRACDECSPGFFDFPNCQPCMCDQAGSIGISCDAGGNCQCKYNFDGVSCDKCRDKFYNFPLCEECNCDPAGVLQTFAGCGNAPVGELCECKERVTGRICNKCSSLFWNLQQNNPLGCEECDCHTPGTVGALATCPMNSGQCACKPHVTSRRCDECKDGTYNLVEDNVFGCSDCQCNIGGSNNNNCDKVTGQCSCRYRIQGQRCDQPMKAHYFPTLYQHKFEIEDGRTPQNTPVRFRYDNAEFPGFSWWGYAVYSEHRKETLHDVYISKPSLYRLIFYYMNPSDSVIKGKITATPENPQDDKQEVDVYFQPTSGPELMTVSAINNFPLPFVMNPGTWTIGIQSSQNLYLDYLVLLPLPYYEATLLVEHVTAPSHAGSGGSGLHFAYPDVGAFDAVFGSAGYRDLNGSRSDAELYDDQEVLSELNSPPMAWLGANSDEIHFDMRLRKPGEHVVLLNYYTPEGARASSVGVTSYTRNGIEKGRAVMYDCTYTWICRQVVTNLQGEVAVFDFDTNYVNIVVSIRGDAGQDLTLHSVVAVPLEDWHMDLVTPRPACLLEDGQCAPSSFVHPPESTKVEFETNFKEKYADRIPPGVDNSTVLVYLNESDPVVDITGKLRHAGRYIFIVHYFQPNHPEFSMDVLIQNGQFFEGILSLQHCPSVYGCRAIITHLDGHSDVFDILENFVLTLKTPKNFGVWLDYLLVISEENFVPEFLERVPRDNTAEFFERCASNHFSIDPKETGFCREAVFALTSEYNNGALPCHCNFKGSVSFECEVFGGQCPCKPNVIGKQCTHCKMGYFGFPDCRPCDCPSRAFCDPANGECICPPRVVGDRCDRCAINTYGFDPNMGCEECRCNEIGVRNGDLQCDLLTGQCRCRDNVVGRRCERCDAGYWSFPFCQLCNCDVRGTEVDICSQSDATCFCKKNTEGPSCDLCSLGTFHLEESNPDGCTKCFCFGKTHDCSPAFMVWTQMPPAEGWKTAQMDYVDGSAYPKLLEQAPEEFPNLALLNLSRFYEPQKEGYVYLKAPENYYGNRVASYGGEIAFKLLTISEDQGEALASEGDVILQGDEVTALYFHDAPLEYGLRNEVRIHLIERNFKTLEGVPLRREQFMTMLYKLDGIFIRVHYGSYSTEARLSDFSMTTGTYDYQRDSISVYSVEQCKCPPNYSGTSCEDCAPGYFRASTGPYGGFCVPCKCNNHADTCDTLTGECLNCRDNTVGFHCDTCAAGYFGNAQKRTPYDCLICSCPLPSVTNNFATSCRLRPENDEIECHCQEGYVGTRCNICAPGYFGQPMIIGDFCKPCECSGNIDVTSPYACDDISGLCLSCLNNTFGSHCERCAPGYFGDAILLKNCQRCSCDECGTRECQHYTGVCECHENVIGDRCEQCAPEYWGFASCQGCHPCNCAEASESRQCDEETGQCPCRPGVTGQRCDRCKPGYWSYTEFGCKECTCRAGFSVGVGCDPVTGQCSCLPGVIGDNCEGCPDRWVLVEGMGCQECDACVHTLLDTTDGLHEMISPVISEYESAARSFFLHQRLQVINDSVAELRPKVEVLDISDDDLKPVRDTIDGLYTEALSLSNRADGVSDRAAGSATDGLAVRDQAREVLDAIFDGTDVIRDVIDEINSLVIGLETGTGAKIELAIHEAENIVNSMMDLTFSPQNDKVRLDYEVAEEFLDQIKNMTSSGTVNSERVEEARDRLTTLQDKIEEMQEKITEANEKTFMIDGMNRKSRVYGLEKLQKKHSDISRLGDETKMNIEDAMNYTDFARTKLENAEDIYNRIDGELTTLQGANVRLNESVTGIASQLADMDELVDEAIHHAHQLIPTADELDSMLAGTRQATENALRAANAYDDIASSLEKALRAAQVARNVSGQAVDMSDGVSEDSKASYRASADKNELADEKISQVENDLHPQLVAAREEVQQLEKTNDFTDVTLDSINRKLDGLEGLSITDEIEKLMRTASEIDADADGLINDLDTRYDLEGFNEIGRSHSKNLEDVKSDPNLALEQVEHVEKILPGMQQETRDLLLQKGNIHKKLEDVGDRLERLRRTITKTRDKTNKIKVGIDFQQGSVLELKNPDDLSDTATAMELSVFIKTPDRFGLPLFLGTPVGGSNLLHRTSTDDFMAIELEEGYVRLTTKLGKEAHSIVNGAFVADDKWHKIYIKRIGKVVQLSVHSEDEDGNEDVVTVEKVLPGTYSILNLNPKVSKLYVGGIPAGVEVDESLMNTFYTGQMEELWINKRPIGLWNFVSRGSKEFPLKGAKERLVLKTSKATSHVLTFDGTGYVAVETKGHETSPELSTVISFKTFAEDGLIYLLENGEKEFVSLEIRGGKVMYQHMLESGLTSLLSEGVYNDDEWHTIEATRVRGDALMKIDSGDVQQSRSQRSGNDFTKIPEVMYFGGFPGEHTIKEITNEDFRGCIRDVRVTEVTVDFSRSRESIGTVPGCVKEEVSLVSFHPEDPGYVKLTSPEGSGLQLVFKFRTDNPNGLLFYTETSDRSNYLSLSLAEGALVLRSAPGGELTTGSYTKYNDSAWHIVIASKENNELRLDVDDFENFWVPLTHEVVPFDGPVFFGGYPEYYSISAAAAAADNNFFGCIGDATLNGRIIDFASANKRDRPGAMLDTCSITKEVTIKTFAPDSDDAAPKYPIDAYPVTLPPRVPYPEAEEESTDPPEVPEPDREEYPSPDPILTFPPTVPRIEETTPPSMDRCALPVTPAIDDDVTAENGLRFGGKRDSRIEYDELPDNIRGDFVFSVEFRTLNPNGIIFYAASLSHRDFVTIYINDGKIVFAFNPGSSSAIIRSIHRYNDDKWHKLVAHRTGDNGRLEIDGFIVNNGSISGQAKHIDHQAPYFFGGVSSEIVELVIGNTEQTFLPFNGCLRGFRMNNKIVGGKRKVYAVSECSYKVEPGVFFGEGKVSHAVVRLKFHVGLMFEMSLEIKPRKNTGVIMSVHGRRDFILLQLRDGIVEFKVDNGKGIVTAQYDTKNAFSICDGNWHRIDAIKNKHVIVLTVDGISAEPASGPLGPSSVDTNKPLFIGSQPRLSARRGNAVEEKYVGCMRNVSFNREQVDLNYILFVGEANAGACPLI